MSAAPGRQRTMADRRHASWSARLCQGGGDALWLSVAVGVKVAEVSPACPQGQAGLYVRGLGRPLTAAFPGFFAFAAGFGGDPRVA